MRGATQDHVVLGGDALGEDGAMMRRSTDAATLGKVDELKGFKISDQVRQRVDRPGAAPARPAGGPVTAE